MSNDPRQRAAAFLEANEITDDASEALDEMVTDMANHIAADKANAMGEHNKYDELHDAADAAASKINNGGHEAQIEYLIEEGCSEDYIRQTIFDSAESAPAGP
jgi:hypothetical protein